MNLREKAIKLSTLYQQNQKVKGILLAGSVSREWQDNHSDIELHILWSEPPSDSERLFPIKLVNGRVIDFFPYEDEEWSETYLTEDNIKLEISNFLVETVETYIQDVVNKLDLDYDKQCILSSITYGRSLYGHDLLNKLKKDIEIYPSKLAEKMILSNLDLGNRWNNRNALLDRNDWLMLYEVICSIQKKLLATLLGLNKMYIHHPAFKWMHHIIDFMDIKPDNLDNRLSQILLGEVNDGISELELLIEEVQCLVTQHYPHINIEQYKQKANFVRPKN
ncbi:DUF4037 domain-containing protein [Metabacillus elymi]|uniref:DUF4037 domain-containing protein n=1 Tax=Metabacillus elymi TaxID=2745198 RepID=A0ABX6S1E0_9BACI|nr:DUF4037 domain-containing protein [Metabacillus sp. KUDC1714]QNF26675.1 DUF4037 domain-containing protein [Metabacillus sp. KUDC1714]